MYLGDSGQCQGWSPSRNLPARTRRIARRPWCFSARNPPLPLGNLASSRRDVGNEQFYNGDDDSTDFYNERASRKSRLDDSSPYWSNDADNEFHDKAQSSSGGFYNVHFDNRNGDAAAAPEPLAWERCATDAGVVQVLLPPASVALPTAVLHFVGGTLFGSAPSVWYQQLLRDLVQHTNVAVLATSIPVTIRQSPLQHVALARTVQRQFRTAWRDVLLDEYGEDVRHVPVCGVGHSLGARLLVVLATLPPDTRPTKAWRPPPYQSYILISFTNYGAAAGIPGIYQLGKASRKVARSEADNTDDHDYQRGTNAERGRTRRPRSRDEWYDEDEDEDWGELVEELQSALRDQAAKVQSALTPKSTDLEFFPTPEQLWKALQEDHRYTIPQTLVVQFDDDDIDQSSKLALAIHSPERASLVRFARLRGTHLTPVSVRDDSQPDGYGSRAWWKQLNSSASRILGKLLASRRQRRPNGEALRELRQSMARYITEIVTK
jgi:hypothetical protein